MESKKPTNAQLARRIDKAVLHIDRTKDTKTIFFSDRGLRLTVTDDFALVETNYHRHVFSKITASGISRPYMYVAQVIDIALSYAEKCATESGYSFAKLLDALKDNDLEYNIVTYVSWWLYNIFQPLYMIGEDVLSTDLVYEEYLHNLARSMVMFEEKKEDVTNLAFINKIIAQIKKFTVGLPERVMFHKKTDEELAKEEIEALQEQEMQQTLNETIKQEKNNGSQD